MTMPIMSRKWTLILTVLFLGGNLGWAIDRVDAATPLSQATVQAIRNSVQLFLKERQPRPAKVKDTIAPGDALKTARASMVELQFNDRSLARIGEYALFQFVPNTRTLQLKNGTILMLIPPGQGTTQIRTPNAAAGIRGSALFVRYIPETDTTIVGALTNSGIQVATGDQSAQQSLQAGQMAVVVQNRIERVYNFDLRTFYQTSDLVKGLELQSRKELTTELDPAIAAVREETIEALETQSISNTATTIQNPSFLRRPSASIDAESERRSFSRSRFQPTQAQEPSATNRSGGRVNLPEERLGDRQNAFPPTLLPTTISPTLSLPNSPLVTTSPGQPGVLPGVAGGTSGGRGGNPFGGPPGRTGSAPGLSGNTPGQSGGTAGPPGQTGAAPGLSGNTPGQSSGVSGPPGQTGTAPGLSGNTPGQSGGTAGPPGQTGAAPGLSGATP
ncbi:MAG: FecR domain-containing protein [Oscillatoriales cyanobacterium C42_A2020_001]|nr:FecR domain-containing protein [Leptolyngbyaceae cyanobacterium C42_A2020_001]